MSEQPTNEELSAAWTDAMVVFDIPGARADAIQKLKDLRNKRTTWYGTKEINLMYSLDKFIKSME